MDRKVSAAKSEAIKEEEENDSYFYFLIHFFPWRTLVAGVDIIKPFLEEIQKFYISPQAKTARIGNF